MQRREALGNAPVPSCNNLGQPATQGTHTAPLFQPPFRQSTSDSPRQGVEEPPPPQRPPHPRRLSPSTFLPVGLGRVRTPAVDPSQIVMSGGWPIREVNSNPEMELASPWQAPAGETHMTRRRSPGITPKTTPPRA
ncbi:hypothetical protein ACHAP5_001591 [Fusarium lateritium]